MFPLEFHHPLFKGGHFVIRWIFSPRSGRKDIGNGWTLTNQAEDSVTDRPSPLLKAVNKLWGICQRMADSVVQIARDLLELFYRNNPCSKSYIGDALSAGRPQSARLHIPTIRLVLIIA
jgi:hypothetical protein